MLSARVITPGALAANHLWNERAPVRTGYATTTLIRAGRENVVVDPGLPANILAARFGERTPIKPEQITHLFVTAFTWDHLRGADLFPNARYLMHAPELDAATDAIRADLEAARRSGNAEDVQQLDLLRAVLQRFEPAEDTIVRGVDLFPLPGVTPGTCGLLIAQPALTTVVAGDAVASIDHLEEGQVLTGCWNLEQARESLREVIEIADLIIPGRDGLTINPVQQR